MPPTSPEPTIGLIAETSFDLVQARYDAAWREALVTGGPPPDREQFLSGAGPDREGLASILDLIDGVYLRLRELNSGAATLSPRVVAPLVRPVAHPRVPTPSGFAETLDSFQPEPEAPANGSQFAETVDTSPGGTGTETNIPDAAPLEEGAALGGYELLGVLAHGGMGVVYKGRHTRLDRLAAIKMVLAGAHASPVQLARFRAEAQVVASLQHPNIVQLYEVGEHDNLPYIALEFVEGGSLANKAGGQPQPPREAAATVEVLARAMDYAHGKGVVHRDLKPANVLLTASGAPKVTDFGLAKRLETDSGQTRSGTLMGTPSYMAPEQAAGLVHAIGPHTDTYALGAILYELLTGGAPFSGSTPLKTVLAVLKTDPVAPRRLQPDVPPDLETICLKCLEKEPSKRYESAAALADDLRRFLAGEAIRARPVGRAERLWRWCRRNPGVAALTAVVVLLLTTVAGVSTAAAVRVGAEKRAAEQNAATALEAQGRAESALEEAERQKGIANKNEAEARAAQNEAVTAKTATDAALKETREAKAATDAALKQTEAARRRAEELATVAATQRELALDAFGGLVTKVQDQLDDAPGTQQLKRELLELALVGLTKVAGKSGGPAVADIRMADGHRRLGDLAQRLGDLALARRSYEEVDRIVRVQAAANPADPTWQRAVSVAEAKLGDLCLLTGDKVTARRHYEETLKIRTELAPTGGIPAQVDLAQVYVKLANVSTPDKAVVLQKDALRLREAILKTNPDDPNARRDVRVSHYQLADAQLKAGDVTAALSSAQKAVELAATLERDYPRVARLKEDLARARAMLGNAYRADKRVDDARKEYEVAVRVIEPLATQNPQDLVLQITTALFLAHAGRHADAAKLAARTIDRAPKNAFLLYNAACVYSIAAETAGVRPEADLTPEERKLVADYGEAALRSLKGALAAKFPDHDLIRTDPELAAVRKLSGFAEIAKSLRPLTAGR